MLMDGVVEKTIADDVRRYRALLRHEIKSLEVQYHHGQSTRESVSKQCSLLEALCVKYFIMCCLLEKYYLESSDKHLPKLGDITFSCVLQATIPLQSDKNVHYLLESIDSSKTTYAFSSDDATQLHGLRHILSCYKTIHWQLSSAESQGLQTRKDPRVMALKSRRLADFVPAVIDLFELDSKKAVDCDTMGQGVVHDLLGAHTEHLDALTASFEHLSTVQFINQLAIIKSDATLLFNQNLHVERKLSIQRRASLLHRAMLAYCRVLKKLNQNEPLNSSKDWVLMGGALPQGIKVLIEEDDKSQIIFWLKTVTAINDGMDEFYQQKFDDVLNAFKFWFNPMRLVDSLMAIETQLKKDAEGGAHCHYKEFISSKLSQLSSADLIQLYGYFTNKDVNYLMLTLKAASTSYPFEWLARLNSSDKQLLNHVYELIELILNALRQVLANRAIGTTAYLYTEKKGVVKPGRRNRQCLQHILSVYRVALKTNPKLDGLFERLEQA